MLCHRMSVYRGGMRRPSGRAGLAARGGRRRGAGPGRRLLVHAQPGAEGLGGAGAGGGGGGARGGGGGGRVGLRAWGRGGGAGPRRRGGGGGGGGLVLLGGGGGGGGAPPPAVSGGSRGGVVRIGAGVPSTSTM